VKRKKGLTQGAALWMAWARKGYVHIHNIEWIGGKIDILHIDRE